jgi:tetratricopeptide (TPR) repeat protein
MDPSDPDHQTLEQRLDGLLDRMSDLIRKCHFRSALRVTQEVRRLARAEEKVIWYLHALFHEADLAKDLLDPETTRERSVELIALLESEERARQLQGDLPEQGYFHTVAWMSACAYENFAEATGSVQGYNSEGMHSCIADGIQVCRQTGKLQCISCFREYATNVYTAADDLDLALHQARSVATYEGPKKERGDRRWLGCYDEAWLLLLLGQPEAAEAAALRGLSLCEAQGVGVKLSAQQRAQVMRETVQLAAGKRFPETAPSPAHPDTAGSTFRETPHGEYPAQDLRWALNDALAACYLKAYDQAIEALAAWDRWLTEHHCLHEWFEVRLRLIAACRLAGHGQKIAPLARQLETRAEKARDWLTLRRLTRLLDADQPEPLALLASLPCGPFAAPGKRAVLDVPPAEQQPEAERPAPPSTPLQGFLDQQFTRYEQGSQDPAVVAAILSEVLALESAAVPHPFDAIRLLHFVCYLLGDASRVGEVWRWGQAIAAPFAQQATVLSLLAVLGDIARTAPDEAIKEQIPLDRLEQLFQRSLDLDRDDSRNFARAGAFYLSQENYGEAERCLARGFRLDRGSSFLALRLAEVYRQTERPRDALAVLDLCLREGCLDPQVAWEAGLVAYQLGQYDTLLAYLDRFEQQQPGAAWANYYRATALLELGKPEAALTALDEEERRSPERPFPVTLLRACALGQLGQIERHRELLEQVLATRLAGVDYLTIAGLSVLLARLWKATACLPAEDPFRVTLAERLLVAGFAPDEIFEAVRELGEPRDGINYYRCVVLQPLDERWAQSPGCLTGQDKWQRYRILWGVLAPDEEEAAKLVLAWQARCYPLPATVEETELQDEGYKDRPGVVWQGMRWGE